MPPLLGMQCTQTLKEELESTFAQAGLDLLTALFIGRSISGTSIRLVEAT
jgi:hypothetical protein